jgi:hypothetical protein
VTRVDVGLLKHLADAGEPRYIALERIGVAVDMARTECDRREVCPICGFALACTEGILGETGIAHDYHGLEALAQHVGVI